MRIKNFTFFTAIIAIFALATPQYTYSQVYQFENPGFEDWPGAEDSEPTGWNSYPSANCTMSGLAALGCSTAKQARHKRSTDVRPGSTNNNYSCLIYAKSVLGVVANGALTSGQMQLASTSMSNPNNGNRTIQNNNDFNHRLNAKPDSIVFWAKVVNGSDASLACCHLYIHDNYNLQDPLAGNEDQAGYASHIVGKVPSYDFTNNGSTWQRHSAPIEYDGCQSNDPQFILITFSTNKDAGGGSNNDKLYLDDIQLIYNANLSSITVNGSNIPNFNQNTTEYYVDVPCGSTNYISATTASPRAAYTTSLSSDGKTVTINVTHGDKAKTYTVHYRSVITNQISDEICKGDSYSQNGFTLPIQNNAGTFNHSNSYPLANGCDSVVELRLTVNDTYTTNIDLTICESATYNFFGQELNQPGTYQHLLTSQHGCDSTIRLNLRVDDHYQVNIPEHICEGGEEYHNNGFDIDYSEIMNRSDNVIFDTLFFAAGTVGNVCDSIVVLHLEVGRIDNTTLSDSIDIDNDYNGNGFEIAAIHEAGEYTFTNTLTNEEGCDSIVTLTLKVLPKPVTPEPEPTPEIVTFEIFPNPTSTGQITVRANYDITKDIYEYLIFNEHGMLMDTGCINSKDTFVDVSKYNSGYYYLKVLVGDTVKAQKKRKAIKFVVVN
ncbi:MAG: T9SS type A sorting domain-containing protein [Bacteroidales bacterium]|nr:T9SS type A sorting domain-containing protein [Bacteroidales bacterium]